MAGVQPTRLKRGVEEGFALAGAIEVFGDIGE